MLLAGAPLGTPPARDRPGRARTRSSLRASSFRGGPIDTFREVVLAAAVLAAAGVCAFGPVDTFREVVLAAAVPAAAGVCAFFVVAAFFFFAAVVVVVVVWLSWS